MMMKKSALVSALVVVLAIAGCGKKDAAEDAAPEAPVFAVSVTEAVQGQIWDYIPLSGDIVSGSTVDVFSDVAGKVTRVYVDVGARVNRNDPLVAVDPSKPGMDYVPGIARAPISGTVVSLPAQVGMTVSQAVSLARVAGDSGGRAGGAALEITLYVAERFISKVALNQSCEITLDAWPGETFRGSVTEVSPVVDPASRTMEVKINVENPGSKLKAGMFAKVKLITEQKDNIVKIPSSAMVQRFGETYVFIADGDTAKKRIITPGILIDQVLEVPDGLKAGETVIVRGQTLLDDNARINIVDRVQPLSTAPDAGAK